LKQHQQGIVATVEMTVRVVAAVGWQHHDEWVLGHVRLASEMMLGAAGNMSKMYS
jgi:hypothetical protein